MSELIGGKEAKLAWANGEVIQVRARTMDKTWSDLHGMHSLDIFDQVFSYEFRLKPRTITLNGIEVPAPFEPKEGDLFWHISPEYEKGYGRTMYNDGNVDTWQQFGAWRKEEEIKQVVDALRSVFK